MAEGGGGVDDGDPAIAAQRARHGQSDIVLNSEATNTLAPLGLAVVVVDEMNADTVDVESWVAGMRPSAEYLDAGAAFVGSDELEAHANMLRFIGELSATQMLGEKAGARPGADAATDVAWTYVEENTNQFSGLVEDAVAAAPPERKDDVQHLLTWLVSPLGLRYLRAFARELRRASTASPHASVTDVPTDAAHVNWSACWAWCVQHRTTLTRWIVEQFSRPYLCTLPGRDRHIAAEPFSKVYVVGRTLLSVVGTLVQSGYLAPWRETVCPIDLHTDYFAHSSVAWFSIHPCMHWCCDACLRKWMIEERKDTCPVCRTKIKFALPLLGRRIEPR